MRPHAENDPKERRIVFKKKQFRLRKEKKNLSSIVYYFFIGRFGRNYYPRVNAEIAQKMAGRLFLVVDPYI